LGGGVKCKKKKNVHMAPPKHGRQRSTRNDSAQTTGHRVVKGLSYGGADALTRARKSEANKVGSFWLEWKESGKRENLKKGKKKPAWGLLGGPSRSSGKACHLAKEMDQIATT